MVDTQQQSGGEGRRFVTDIVGGAARAGLMGTPGGALRRVAHRATRTALSHGAARASQAYNRRRAKQGKPATPPAEGKKLTGLGFYLMLDLTLIKDVLDVIFDFSVILSFLVLVTGLVMSFIIYFYLHQNGVKLTSRKLATFIVTAIIGLCPFLSIIPDASVNLVLIRMFENNTLLRRVAQNKFVGQLSHAV